MRSIEDIIKENLSPKQQKHVLAYYEARQKNPELSAWQFVKTYGTGSSAINAGVKKLRTLGFGKHVDKAFGENIGRDFGPRKPKKLVQALPGAMPKARTKKPRLIEFSSPELSNDDIKNHKIKKIIGELLDIL